MDTSLHRGAVLFPSLLLKRCLKFNYSVLSIVLVKNKKFINRIYHTEQEEVLISEFIESSSRHGVKLTAHLTVIGVYCTY